MRARAPINNSARRFVRNLAHIHFARIRHYMACYACPFVGGNRRPVTGFGYHSSRKVSSKFNTSTWCPMFGSLFIAPWNLSSKHPRTTSVTAQTVTLNIAMWAPKPKHFFGRKTFPCATCTSQLSECMWPIYRGW